MTFAQGILDDAPPWLKIGDGGKLLFVAGVQMDAFLDWVLNGLASRFPRYQTDEVLAAIGRDRVIVRGAFETAEGYAERLRGWLDAWIRGGNPFGIMTQVQKYLTPYPVRVRIVNDGQSWYTLNADGSEEYALNLSNWNWDNPDVGVWSRFWLIIYPPAELWTAGPNLGDPDLWGGAIGNDGYTLGSTATPGHVTSIRKIVSDWKDEKSRCERIIVSFDDALFDPAGAADTDGLWANNSKVVSGNRVAARATNARYWRGTNVETYANNEAGP